MIKLVLVAGSLVALSVWAPKDTKQALVPDTEQMFIPPLGPYPGPPQYPDPPYTGPDHNCRWCW